MISIMTEGTIEGTEMTERITRKKKRRRKKDIC